MNDATATGTSPDPDKPDVPVDPGHTDDEPEEKDGHLTITKVTTSETPDEGYALGDTIEYEITVTNDGNLTITDITVTDELTGDEWTIASLAPEATQTFETSYTVTEDDILAGEVVNVATAEGKSPDPDEPDVPVVPGTDPEPTEDLDTTLTVNKTIANEPANGEAFTLGETIQYNIAVTNEGNVTFHNVAVDDELTGLHETIEALAVGETRNITTSYTVTEADILAGSVTNTAVAAGDPIDDPKHPDEPKTPEDEDTVTTGDEDDPDGPTPPIEEKNPHLTLTKIVSGQAPEGGYKVGDPIVFQITVLNDGNVTISGITVTDQFEDLPYGATLYRGEGYTVSGSKAVIPSVAPGASVIIYGYYIVQAENDGTSMVNTVTATGDDPEGDDPEVVPGRTDPIPIVPTYTTATVNKVWMNDTAAQRPAALAVALYRVNADGTETPTGITVDLTEANGWTATQSNLPMYANGQRIMYAWRETEVPAGYTAALSSFVPTAEGWASTIWNVLTPGAAPAPGPAPAGGPAVPAANLVTIEDLETPLGLGGVYNNVGECFE